MLKTLPALAALAAATALVVPTVSQAAEQNSVRVSYADLNLDHRFRAEQAAAADHLMPLALCAIPPMPLDLKFEREVAGCRSGAVRQCAAGLSRQPSVKPVTRASRFSTAQR